MYNEVEKSLCTSQQAILNILYKANSDFVLSGLGLVAPTDDFFRISTLCTLPTGSNLSILTQKYFVWKQPCTKFTTAIYIKFIPVRYRLTARFKFCTRSFTTCKGCSARKWLFVGSTLTSDPTKFKICRPWESVQDSKPVSI